MAGIAPAAGPAAAAAHAIVSLFENPDLLEAAGGDFFKIPNISDINRLAKVTVNDLREGRLYHAGEKRPDLIEARMR